MDSQINRAKDKEADRMRANKSYIKTSFSIEQIAWFKG